jgi:uncharacterized protein (TIGR02996 family)
MAATEKSLLNAIIKNPDADEPRLAYASWLEAHGQEARARLIRLQCQMATMQTEVDALLKTYGGEWSESLARFGVENGKFHRGFVDELYVPARNFVANHQAISALTPIRELTLSQAGNEEIREFAQLSLPHKIHSLTLGAEGDTGFVQFGVEEIRLLTQQPWLNNVQNLTLHSARIGREGARLVAESPYLKNLQRLHLNDKTLELHVGREGPGDHLAADIVNSPSMANLQHLQLGNGFPYGPVQIRHWFREPPTRGHGR